MVIDPIVSNKSEGFYEWKGKEMEKNTHLIQFKLPNNSLLILTSEEFEKALKRGNSVVHNRNLRDKKIDADVLEIEELSHG